MINSGIQDDVPLCVNCDYALLKTDVFQEAVFLFIKKSPLNIFRLAIWILRGRSELIQRVSAEVQINWRTVPRMDAVVQRMRAAHGDNRPVFLLTSMPEKWAQEVSAEFQFSKHILIGNATAGASANDPAAQVTNRFGLGGFDYIGEGRRDLSICKAARNTLIVASDRVDTTADGRNSSTQSVTVSDRPGPLVILKMIRVHQWLKNFLILVPLLAAHRLTSVRSIGLAAVAFLAFSFCASSVYVLNDLLDLESDRQHVRKRNRPIAAGNVTINQALLVAATLLAGSAWLAWEVSPLFALTVGVYFIMTLTYSLRLKRQVIVDVMLLAALYTVRVVAGAVATLVIPSFWLLALSMFLFLSLAVVKRYSEMLVTLAQDRQYAAGRGYRVEDLPVLLSLGVGAGMAAIVVLALYINDPSTTKLYPTTIWLWPVPPLMLYWVSRVWMKAHRGEMHDDPVVFAMRDWQSLITLVLLGACFAAAATTWPIS
jgi:4-hydroxybenzoate polyprenyltransferase